MKNQSRLERHPRSTLLIYVIVSTLIFSLVAGLAVYLLARNGGVWSGEMTTAGTILAAVLGSAIGLAAAIATLYLAVTALQSVKQQSQRDEMELVNKVGTELLTPIQTLSVHLSAVQAAALLLSLRINKFLDDERDNDNQVKLRSWWMQREVVTDEDYPIILAFYESVEFAVKECIRGISGLENSILQIASSPLVSSLWRRGSNKNRYIQICKSRGFASPGRPINENPATYLPVLGACRQHLSAALETPGPYPTKLFALVDSVAYYNMMLSRKTPIEVRPAISSFHILGPSFSHDILQTNRYQSITAAVFADLVDAIPTRQEIQTFVRERFGRTFEDMTKLDSFFSECAIEELLTPEVAALAKYDVDVFILDDVAEMIRIQRDEPKPERRADRDVTASYHPNIQEMSEERKPSN